MTVAKQIGDVHTSMLPQLLVYEFQKRYDLDSYIEKNRDLYRHKCHLMLDCIDKNFPESITHTRPQGGLFVWCDMGEGYDTAVIAKECVKKNVVFVPGSTFMVNMEAPCRYFRLNYSTMSDEKIIKGIEILGSTLKEIVK
jgi:2-aminoadipate transaminase